MCDLKEQFKRRERKNQPLKIFYTELTIIWATKNSELKNKKLYFVFHLHTHILFIHIFLTKIYIHTYIKYKHVLLALLVYTKTRQFLHHFELFSFFFTLLRANNNEDLLLKDPKIPNIFCVRFTAASRNESKLINIYIIGKIYKSYLCAYFLSFCQNKFLKLIFCLLLKFFLISFWFCSPKTKK